MLCPVMCVLPVHSYRYFFLCVCVCVCVCVCASVCLFIYFFAESVVWFGLAPSCVWKPLDSLNGHCWDPYQLSALEKCPHERVQFNYSQVQKNNGRDKL